MFSIYVLEYVLDGKQKIDTRYKPAANFEYCRCVYCANDSSRQSFQIIQWEKNNRLVQVYWYINYAPPHPKYDKNNVAQIYNLEAQSTGLGVLYKWLGHWQFLSSCYQQLNCLIYLSDINAGSHDKTPPLFKQHWLL